MHVVYLIEFVFHYLRFVSASWSVVKSVVIVLKIFTFTGKEKPSAELQKSYIAVVAIDFGTSYSGFAFSFNKGQEKDAIFMNKDWTNEQGSRTSKAPTCLLLAPELTFHSFGYEAMENYAQLQSEEEEQQYFFFQHFKMALHSDTVSGS